MRWNWAVTISSPSPTTTRCWWPAFWPTYQKIWGKDSLGDVRTVQVHIHNLRSKIEPDPAKPVYLCNVWGKGYVFRPEGKQE